ncbi:hypothetical protein [Psychrobacillus vulpis]|uniref:Sigma-X negative effector n=1 Tax=Psychrobacillus vulpis TaxID=2325572 RepID=A0A544TUF2_9BACI|nr:hypothetical protein [Psychrobacillus vulpis]TQR21079.1 hypothetical protein FG384_05650 [Psychrobacillus vulpis]
MSDWKKDEDALDELLSQMPKFTDHRSKEDVYNGVKLVVEAQLKEEKRKVIGVSFSKWIPFLVSVASILVLTFLVSSYLNDDQTAMLKDSSSSKEEKSSMQDNMRSIETKPKEEASMASDEIETKSTEEMTTMSSFVESNISLTPLSNTTAVYANSIDEGTIFHFSLIENALSVPITIIIPKEKIENDFPNMTPKSFQLYERYASMINEQELGFNEYHPYKGYFVDEGKTLKHFLPKDHGYDTASGTSGPYWGSINEIFTDFDSIAIVNEDGSPIEWDQVGVLNEPSKLEGQLGHHNYYNYLANNGNVYLSPNFRATYDSVSEAILAMKQVDNDIYSSVIPKEVTYSYKEENGIGIIHFNQPLDLEKMDSFAATRLIEAFALTANSFGTEVRLDNVLQRQWEEFDLTKPLPVPLGPNGFIMSEQ